ncbi:MAG: hypothetical protein NTY56_03125 [Patescibacteria group bacterium]|nr:hypothetical protein [Patescibacteria group bacterium]
MDLESINENYSKDQLPELHNLLKSFLLCEIQLIIGDTSLRSWEKEDIRLQALDVAKKLRAPPWNFKIDDLLLLADDANSILDQLEND